MMLSCLMINQNWSRLSRILQMLISRSSPILKPLRKRYSQSIIYFYDLHSVTDCSNCLDMFVGEGACKHAESN